MINGNVAVALLGSRLKCLRSIELVIGYLLSCIAQLNAILVLTIIKTSTLQILTYRSYSRN